MTHRAHPSFWPHYQQLPKDIRELADKNFKLLKSDPRHSSVSLKKVAEGPGLHESVCITERLLLTILMAAYFGSGSAITANTSV
jgi:hypothetical protein